MQTKNNNRHRHLSSNDEANFYFNSHNKICMWPRPVINNATSAFATPVGELTFQRKIDGASEKIRCRQRIFSKGRPLLQLFYF